MRTRAAARIAVWIVTSAAIAAFGARMFVRVFAPPPPMTALESRAAKLGGDLQNLFGELAETVRPAVVSIVATEIVELSLDEPEGSRELPRGLGIRRRSLGSGVVVDSGGYILTNAHVLGSGQDVRVRLWDNELLPATVIREDETLDVALVKVRRDNLIALPMGDSDTLKVGHWILAVGNPFGLSHTVSAGIVSAVGRSDIGLLPYESFIQTDANIHKGNSGGPLVNLDGEIVGINTAIYSKAGGDTVGIGFAVPINLAKSLIARWIAGKSAAYLGIETRAVDADMARYYGLEGTNGTFVQRVKERSPAHRAGLEERDVILAFDGNKVRDTDHFRVLLAESEAGRPIAIEVFRYDRKLVLVANLESPLDSETGRVQAGLDESAERPGATRSAIGVTLSTLTSDLANGLGLDEKLRGVVVLDVDHGSPADEKGLQVGDVIREVNTIPTKTIRSFRRALEKSDRGVMLKVERRGDDIGYVFLPR